MHELRNLVNTAIVAFEVLKKGQVGFAGSTGAVLNRSLVGLRDLIARSLDEVRWTRGVKNRKRILVSEFIDEVGAAATLEARCPQHRVDRATRARRTGDRGRSTSPGGGGRQSAAERVQVHPVPQHRDVKGWCQRRSRDHRHPGRMWRPSGRGDAKELFPSFEQQGADRTGLGIGLAFSRWGAEAHGGRLYARNLPGEGCVFTVDLPRSPAPVARV